MTLFLLHCLLSRSSMTPTADPRRQGFPPTVTVGRLLQMFSRWSLRAVRPLSAENSLIICQHPYTARPRLPWDYKALEQREFTSCSKPFPWGPFPARQLHDPARKRINPTKAMQHIARYCWTLSRPWNAATYAHGGKAGLARAKLFDKQRRLIRTG